MEEGLLFKAKDQEEEGGKKNLTWDAFVEEAEKVGNIAGPIVGMASGLETLCGQAYGAQQYQKLGVHAYSAIISLILLVCIPISFVWISMEKILIFIGQDPVISHEAGRYATCMIPALFSWAILRPLMKYHQTQSLIVPIMLLSSMTTSCLHVPLCWVFVFQMGFGNIGTAFACGISYWLNFLSLAVPSAVMVW
ncbi:hypothetical protein MKX03_030462 [Papaver bracteatum]|nr:hypothetical protein MKX03_030462 [Papaver bracteatum]